MFSLQTWRSLLTSAAVLSAFATAAFGSEIQSTPSLPPQGAYTAATVCVPVGPGVCVVGASLSGFTGTTSIFDGTGQAVDSTVSLNAKVYSDSSGSPGVFLGSLMLSGDIGIEYFGRTSDSQLGTFNDMLTELDLTGTFNGHSVDVMLNPGQSSVGITTVAPNGSNFMVSSFFDVFVELSIDHGQFIAGPPREFTLTPAPEPSTISLLAVGLLAAVRLRSNRQK